jgi:transcriptional regulator with XRE-family HTH domain
MAERESLACARIQVYPVSVSPQVLGDYLRELREAKGMSLRDVERATGGEVSNAYLSQLEQGKRIEPGPRYLTHLARVYDTPVELLFQKAGYTDAPTPSEVDIALEQVKADPSFKYGTRLKGELDESAKRVIIELYEKATGKTLLSRERNNDEQDRST